MKIHECRRASRILALLAGTLLAGVASPAMAGSVTQPGETIGLASGAPLPQGVYLLDTTDYGQYGKESLGVTIPVVAWSTPATLLGGRLQLYAAFPLAEASTPDSHVQGWYNLWFAGQLAWDLGHGVGVSYLLGTYPKMHSPVANDSTTINQRFAISYTGNGYDLTANLILGNEINTQTVPNYLNLDLTATKNYGKWSFGPVGYYSTDTSTPYSGYAKQSQFAMGGLVGYNFGPVILQSYLTHAVTQTNYPGNDTRFWFRLIVPVS
ncbi:transporter [Acidocella sp.]|uniref:transporter n=1 Tax=Acidocella sp. TaxID=50710 RepID=UPI003CFC0951